MKVKENLSKKLRQPSKDKKAPEEYPPLNPASKQFAGVTEDGRATFAGVYRKLIDEVRNGRKWERATAKRYDAVMAKKSCLFLRRVLSRTSTKRILQSCGEE